MAIIISGAASWARAAELSVMSQKFAPLYSQIEKNYHRSDVHLIEAYGRKALRLRGADRLYALWSVFYVYKDHMVYDKLQSWIRTARDLATKDQDKDLQNFADLFQFSLDQDGDRSAISR